MLDSLRDLPSPLFILGPAYSGKSELAHTALDAERPTCVIGTAGLNELGARVESLKAQRPAHWTQLDCSGEDLADVLLEAQRHSEQILLDSLNQWLANLVIRGLTRYDLSQQEARIEYELKRISEAVRTWEDGRLVLVSSEIGAGVTPPQEVSRFFRQMLGKVHVAIAREARAVVQVVAGIAVPIKVPKQ